MRGSLQLIVLGLAVGMTGAAPTARLIQTPLIDVQPFDPVVYAGVASLFTTIASLAWLPPSLRASRIDPLLALRAD